MDWKGAALVLQQLGELRKPSQLEIAEKEYELEAKEAEAKRRHELALASLEGIQSNIENLDKLLVEKVKAGNDIAIGLSSIGKKENISGNAASLNEQLYSQEFANYEGIRKDLNTQYNDKYEQLNEQVTINKFASLGKEFQDTQIFDGKNYFQDAQIALGYNNEPILDVQGNPIVDKSKMKNDLSFQEMMYLAKKVSREIDDPTASQAFYIGATSGIKQEAQKKSTYNFAEEEPEQKSLADKNKQKDDEALAKAIRKYPQIVNYYRDTSQLPENLQKLTKDQAMTLNAMESKGLTLKNAGTFNRLEAVGTLREEIDAFDDVQKGYDIGKKRNMSDLVRPMQPSDIVDLDVEAQLPYKDYLAMFNLDKKLFKKIDELPKNSEKRKKLERERGDLRDAMRTFEVGHYKYQFFKQGISSDYPVYSTYEKDSDGNPVILYQDTNKFEDFENIVENLATYKKVVIPEIEKLLGE